MALVLILGDPNYSSWSLRAWALLRWLEAPFEERRLPLYTRTSRQRVMEAGGAAGQVPVLIDDGFPVWETPAIFEHMAESDPRVWPADFRDRSRARSLCGEVHAGIAALRAAAPMNIRGRRRIAEISAAVIADIRRMSEVFAGARRPWLFGDFSAADVMMLPVAMRFRTYEIELVGEAAAYAQKLLDHPIAKEADRLAEVDPRTIAQFELPRRPATASPAKPRPRSRRRGP